MGSFKALGGAYALMILVKEEAKKRLGRRVEVRELMSDEVTEALRPQVAESSGFSLHAGSGERREAVGKAYFVGESDVGQLKVSFFGPFYGGYNIIALDKKAYQYSLVSGPSREYLWLLSRTPQMDPAKLIELIGIATNQDDWPKSADGVQSVDGP